MSQSSVARQPPEEQRVVSKSLTQRSEDGRGDDPQQTAHPTEKRSLTLETEAGKGLQNHVKISGTPQLLEEQTATAEPLGKSWVRKNDEDDNGESENTRLLSMPHSLSLTKINYKLNVDDGILSDDPKNRAFKAFIVKNDPSVEDYLYDIEKLHSKVPHKLWSNQYFIRREEYKKSIKNYITCRKKHFKESKADEEQKNAIVKTARESLETLRECLLDINFEVFAETEEGREIALLEEKARKIYQATTDEVQEKIDQEESLYADFLSSRNAFLPDWSIPEDDTEQEEYTEQEIHSIDRMRENLQKYVDISLREVRKSYERSLNDKELLNNFIEFLTQEDSQDVHRLSLSYDAKDIENVIQEIKSLDKHIQEGLFDDHEFQEDYYEKNQEYLHLVDRFRKAASAKGGRGQNKDGTGAQEQTVPTDILEQSPHAQEAYDDAAEVLFHLMDIREVLLERSFECFAETEQGKEIARLEEKAREVYWATTDQVREKGDQHHAFYADFLSSRNAFLCRWNRAEREAGQEKYTEQEIRYIDQMKESLQLYIDVYQQEVKRSYEQFIEYEALHERMVISLSGEEQQEIRRLLQLKGLKDLKNLLEDVRDLHKDIYEEWHDNPDFQRNNLAFQEEYYEKYNMCNNFIDQFKKSETLEIILKVIAGMIAIRYFLLMKESDTLFAKMEERGEITSREGKARGVSQRKSVQSQIREETHQELTLKEDEASAVEKNFEAFLENEEGKQIDSCLGEINRYLNYNKYIKKIVEKELNKFEIKKREIFGNYDKFLENNEYLKKKQMRDLNNYAFTAKIKIEERIYVLFLHHAAGQGTQQLEEKYRTFADTIDFLFETIPLDLQNDLRTPAKQYNAAKADLVKQLVSPQRSESSVKSCVEKLKRSLEDQITSMKENIWLQFKMFWYKNAVKDKITDILLTQGEYKQGELESYIESILNLSSKITDELYKDNVLRGDLKMLFSYNIRKSKNDEYDEDEDRQLYDEKAIYDYLILLHSCMMTNCSNTPLCD